MRNAIDILWDGSHIWGLLAWRGIRALGLPCRLVKAQEIACKRPQGKWGGLLLVPGGNARKKAEALGRAGIENIRAFLAGGGNYLGFCGGAGLALAPAEGQASLALCPWPRAPYENRLLHLVSGYLKGRLAGGELASLPVWWPGRFAPAKGQGVEVLAECAGPDTDFWLADIPLGHLPPPLLERFTRRDRGCQNPLNEPGDYFSGQPLVVGGNFGRGRYILSYSHLETPESPRANALLAELLTAAGLEPGRTHVPAWSAPESSENVSENMPHTLPETVSWANGRICRLLALGGELRLFFPRSSWLHGWRSGLPGMACNNLRMALGELARLELTDAAEIYWEMTSRVFRNMAAQFFDRAEGALLETALAQTLARVEMPAAPGDELTRVFGHPMLGGGIAEELLAIVEELIYLSQPDS